MDKTERDPNSTVTSSPPAQVARVRLPAPTADGRKHHMTSTTLSDAEPSPVAIILAAGGSRRMGTPKGLLSLGDRTLIESHIQAMRPFAGSVIVVLGAAREQYRAVIPNDVIICTNLEWTRTEQAESVKIALASSIQIELAWLVPVDTTPAKKGTLEALIAHGAPAVPVDARGRRGHPAFLGQEQLAMLRSEVPNGGVRTLLSRATEVLVDDPLIAMNFNTPADWATYLEARGTE